MKNLIITIILATTFVSANGAVKELNSKNFLTTINSNKPVLVKYWASWCRPCLIMAPKYEAVSKEYIGRIVFAELNVDANTNIANQNYITRLPTIVLYYKGKEVDRFTGLADKKYLREWANNILDYFRKHR